MRPEWEIEERVVYDTPWWRIFNDVVTRPDGGRTTYIWARTTANRGAVMTIPRTEDGRYLMVRIYRHPTRREYWEFVAGLAEEGESPEQTARREVLEEVGVSPTRVEIFPAYTPISGFTGDRFHVALATIPNVNVDDLALQEDEGINAAGFFSGTELMSMVRRGEIDDGITLVALAQLWAAQESA